MYLGFTPPMPDLAMLSESQKALNSLSAPHISAYSVFVYIFAFLVSHFIAYLCIFCVLFELVFVFYNVFAYVYGTS